MTSLNRRVIVTVVGVTSLVVLVASLALWLVMQSMLVKNVDRELASRIERMKRFEPLGSPDFWRSTTNDSRKRFVERGSSDWRMLMQAIDLRDGSELHRSSLLTVGLDLAPIASTPMAIEVPTDHHLEDGSTVRMVAFKMTHQMRGDGRRDWRDGPRPEGPPHAGRPATPGEAPPVTSATTGASTEPAKPPPPPNELIVPSAQGHPPETPHQGVMIYIALGLEQVDGELSRMAMVLGVLWAAATLLAFGTILLLRPAVLKPTRDLAAAIARLGPDDLAARVPVQEAPQEMRVVVDCLNGLFDRLEQAFKREQATIANIAHELRTPVAELRTALEFRQMTATGEDRAELDALLTTVMRMQTQVSNLLLLARLEAGKETLVRSDADLGDLVSEVVERWEDRANARGLDLSLGTFARAPVTTSPDHLGLVLDNLFSNAVAHATAAGVISVTVAASDHEVSLTVANPFSGTLDMQQLSQAYYRGDDARHGGDHTGLGLALCQRLCRLLDARLELSHADGQFRASVVLKKRG
ncbi:MAG: GHKL domain-containing protein [Planctomycetes bacterium]|nr:GHKL domain-containing protein [Planctomycetota bacterium]